MRNNNMLVNDIAIFNKSSIWLFRLPSLQLSCKNLKHLLGDMCKYVGYISLKTFFLSVFSLTLTSSRTISSAVEFSLNGRSRLYIFPFFVNSLLYLHNFLSIILDLSSAYKLLQHISLPKNWRFADRFQSF